MSTRLHCIGQESLCMLENEKDITDLHLGKRGTLYSAVFNNVHSYNNFVRLKFCHMKILMITLFYSY